jgi:hypothetical protein
MSLRRSPAKEVLVGTTRVLLATVLALAFGGCVVRGPEIEVKPPIEIKAEPRDKFCPPGHAKKGDC